MPEWFDNHRDWIQQVTASFCQKQKMSFEDFEDVWLHGSFPLNTAGILVLARAYKIHVTVFFNDNYWTTDAAADINKSSVFLAYRGDLEFHETRRMTTHEYEERRPMFKKLDKYYDNVHVSNALDKIKKFNERVKKRQQSKNRIESDESDITELPQESSVEPVQPKAKANDVVSNIMPTTTDEDEAEDEGYTSEPSSDTPDSSDDKKKNVKVVGVRCSVCERRKVMKGALKCSNCACCAKKEEPTKDEHETKNRFKRRIRFGRHSK